jgi:methionyl-tRNA formyltransferase
MAGYPVLLVVAEVAVSPVGVVAIVGDQLRHRHVLRQLEQHPGIELRGVVVETKRPRPTDERPELDAVLVEHFAARTRAEEVFFGELEAWRPAADVRPVPFGGSNDDAVAAWVLAREPHALVLFGCSIIREQLLERLPERVVNLHLGLSPYYRGAATNFWPLVNGEPECVGATVHLATLSVDAGPILRQTRPEMAADDGSHEIGCRAILAGAEALSGGLVDYVGGRLPAVPQSAGGRVYRNADFHAEAVQQLWRNLDEGLISWYLAEKEARDARRPIVA